MKRIYFVAFGFLAATSLMSCRSETQKMHDAKHAEEMNDDKFPRQSEDDAQFIVDIANMNLQEIHLSELAYAKASMTETKDMASMMLTDHRLMYAEITGLSQKKGVTIPTTPDVEATRKYDKLDKLEGAAFDKEYADMMVAAHKDAIDRVEKIIDRTEDEDVKNFASGMLPKLKTHLEHAEHCQSMAADAKK